ncbi:hypothetical protein [Bradyrhizobium sp. AUGA SZCCT0160]|uniref:hypothetical protein n=1 Tax=Bradyrhizobium sp. AUGA SZCCT0160 TaxID=2807662 RepID=UPI0020119CAD|nr:hypothetical protein [Bradyrhizobium sp. AUGA SZCCT0160]
MSLDEIRSTLFSAKLRRLLAEALQHGERVLWQEQPDAVANMLMWRFLWWIGFPWLAPTAIAISRGWIDQAAMFLLLFGAMMIAAPLVMLLYDWQTLCVITNRRALILRTAWGKPTVRGTSFEDMDATFEILDIGRGAGHLNFASGISTRSPDTDYTGRYGFRCIRNPAAVRDILERARAGTTQRD